MNPISVTIIDQRRRVMATAQVAEVEGRFQGHVDLRPMPPEVRQVFEEFEEIVNGQMLSFLDDVEERVRNFGLRAVVAEGPEVAVEDLQIYPAAGRVSFRLTRAAVPGANGTGSPTV